MPRRSKRIYDALLGATCDLGRCLFALGGGVIGDMTGFAAACTCAARALRAGANDAAMQVDSSVGGKAGSTTMLGKNMIGAFTSRCV